MEVMNLECDIRTIVIHQSPGAGAVDPYSNTGENSEF